MLLIVVLIGVILAAVLMVVLSATRGAAREPRYSGEAPHQGPVMRFTGTGSEVKQDSGKQTTTQV